MPSESAACSRNACTPSSTSSSVIWTGGGRDFVHGHFGRGEIHCESDRVHVYLSHRSRRGYHLFGCRHIDYRPEAMRR